MRSGPALRLAFAAPAILLFAYSSSGWSQPRPSASAPAAPSAAPPPPATDGLPPGHPPIDNMAGMPAEDEGDDTALPPGHPPVDGAPPGMGMGGAPRGRSFSVDDPALPKGTIEVRAHTGAGKPPVGALAKLKIRHQTVASGTTTTERSMPLDAEGKARFDGETIGSEWVYAVSLDYGGVPYEIPMFQLAPQVGKRLEMTVFETTEDMDAALVGVQALMYLDPQETAFQVEQLFRFSNLSDKTWRCAGMTVNLPRGYKAFVEDEERSSLKAVEVSGQGLRISGFVSPGTTQVLVRYQLPFPDADTARYEFGLPARVGRLTVIGAIPPSMGMRVDNLPPTQPSEGNDGRKLQVTELGVPVGGDQIELASVNLTGLPVRSPTRWYALGLSLLAMVSGLVVAIQRRAGASGEDEAAQWEAARQALLRELEGLERARRAGDVGPRTYEQARRQLINQLATVLAAKPVKLAKS